MNNASGVFPFELSYMDDVYSAVAGRNKECIQVLEHVRPKSFFSLEICRNAFFAGCVADVFFYF